jgi:hypothetical protein
MCRDTGGLRLHGMPLPRFAPACLLTLTVLAAPSAASAAQTLGSPLDGSRGTVDAVGCDAPCTLVQDTIDGLQVHADGGVVTRWKAVVAAGSTATLRVVTRGGDGTYTAVATGRTITGDDTLQTVADHVIIPVNATIGLDVTGRVGGIRAGGRLASFAPFLADGASASADLTDDELLLQATVEADFDGDGLGDESEDPCVACSPSGGGGSDAGAGGGGSELGSGDSGGSSSAGGGSGSSGGSAADDRGRRFSIGPKALLVPGRRPVVRAYAANGLDDVEGRLVLKVGGKAVGTARISSISGGQDEVDFAVGAQVARTLGRRGARAVVTGAPSVENAGTVRVNQTVSVVHGTTRAFDGTYRGAGPLVIVVRDGAVLSAAKSLLVSSTKGSRSLTRTFALPQDGPVLVGRNGRVEVKGDWKGDTATFRARFKRNGRASGYLSLWHTELAFGSGGSLGIEAFFGASNWIAKRP